MPVFNGERYLEATLASVFAQTYPEIELIVVDDGSTDRSLEILDALGDRVVVVRQQNRGPAAARNLGVQKAWMRTTSGSPRKSSVSWHSVAGSAGRLPTPFSWEA
jgi:cellulose synthase/poly-beta-1,6-N-acetylglucosamine synthase-like glycosyltransferase